MQALRRLPERFGLADDVRTTNVLAYCASSCFSICSVVFLSGATSFVILTILHQPEGRVGRISGNLILIDELVALPSVMVWGALSNKYGVRPVSAVGHIVVACGLVLFVQCRTVSQLYVARAFASVGISALTTMLTAVISSMSAVRTVSTPALRSPQPASESAPLLERRTTSKSVVAKQDRKPARLAGLLGLCSGIGALIGAFVLLRLPPLLASKVPSRTPNDALRFGVTESFYIAAIIPACVGITLLFVLRRRGEAMWSFVGHRDKAPGFKFAEGLKLGFKDADLGLAFISSFAARAIAVTAVTYIPLYIAAWFMKTGRCNLSRPDIPKEQLKEGCYEAFRMASALTGVVQATALCVSPLAGFAASRYSQRLLLGLSLACGVAGFFILAFLADPSHPARWIGAVGIGIGQSGSTVIGLAICARARSRVVSRAVRLDGEDVRQAEVAGAIAGATSFWGGAGILITGTAAGWLADLDARLPFLVCGVVSGLPLLAAIAQSVVRRVRGRLDDE